MQVALDIQTEPKLSAKSEATLFRIFQEAMHNVAKHADAKDVHISLGKTKNRHGFVKIKDNGQGFDITAVTDRVTSAGGLGLRQMRERVKARGGSFELISTPDSGTCVYASLPE